MTLPSFKLLFERPKDDSDTSAKIIAFYKNKILILQNKDNTFELPGGHIKIGETLLAGAKREFEEETGIKVSSLKLVRKIKNRVFYTTTLYNNRVSLSDEHKNYNFVSKSNLFKYPLSLKARKDLKYFKPKKIKSNDNIQDIS